MIYFVCTCCTITREIGTAACGTLAERAAAAAAAARNRSAQGVVHVT